MNEILSVGQLNQQIKGLLEGNPSFRNVFVRGEISNYKKHSSGHHYMTLKDADGAISAVLFRGDALKLRFALNNGLSVVARGRVSAFPKTGQVQLYLADLMPDGAGMLHAAFEQLKEKLAEEGLFDAIHKQPLPALPYRLALITSPTGAAVHDMLRILRRRCPMTAVRIYPTAVQGNGAGSQIATAIAKMNADGWAQVAIVGRGGGSLEDLWAFNEEVTARAIAHSAVPIISAVGHEPDITIADLVADLRAPTPSAAAELAVPEQAELRQLLDAQQERMQQKMLRNTQSKQQVLHSYQNRLHAQSPVRRLQEKEDGFRHLCMRLQLAQQRQLSQAQERVHRQQKALVRAQKYALERKTAHFYGNVAQLDALSPLKVLSRGFATVQCKGKVVTDSHVVQVNDMLVVRVHQGELEARVTIVRD